MVEHKQEPAAGKRLSTRSFLLDEAVIDDYYSGLELTPRADGLAPSTIASGPDNGYFNEIAFSNHRGHLWMRQGWAPRAPLAIGQRYDVGGEIREIYQRRDRSVVHYEVTLHDARGQLVLTTQHHQSFLRDQQSTGEVEFRDPKAKPGTRKFVVPDGESFGGLKRTISVEMCGKFFHGDANYHTDRAASRELGFRDVVVGGRMTMAYATHILEERFGDAWWTSGRLDLKFTNPVWANDEVVANGVVTGPLENERGRTGAFVWLAKPDDTIVLVADATVRG